MFDSLESVRKNWGWFLASGIGLVLVGLLAIGSSVFTTLFTVSFLGVLLAVAGIIEIVYAFWARRWGGFFVQLVMGVLYTLTGLLILWNPGAAAVALTLLMAIMFIVSGIAKIVGSLMGRFPHWGWVLVSGIISVLLGGLILGEWPYSGLWVIGLFVGIDLIFYGWAWILLALGAKDSPRID